LPPRGRWRFAIGVRRRRSPESVAAAVDPTVRSGARTVQLLTMGESMAVERVLIVEDSPTELHVMRSWLARNGFTVLTASSGDEAIEVARQEQPHVILMDVVMPGMNGFQATRRLHRMPETAAIPVLIVSSKSEATDRIWGLRQGAVGYLTKPVSEKVLIDTIRSL
jgi:twitching motility two-component system response regulator PilH